MAAGSDLTLKTHNHAWIPPKRSTCYFHFSFFKLERVPLNLVALLCHRNSRHIFLSGQLSWIWSPLPHSLVCSSFSGYHVSFSSLQHHISFAICLFFNRLMFSFRLQHGADRTIQNIKHLIKAHQQFRYTGKHCVMQLIHSSTPTVRTD